MAITGLSATRDVGTCVAPAGPEGGGGLGGSATTSAGLHVAAVGAYLALSLVLWAHVWFGGDPSHTVTCNCGDPAQQVWWFEWLPWAVAHGHNPLLSNAMWARLGGVNALSNTSWLAPAAVLSPVTALFGPVASYNVANLLAPVLSGWAMFALAGRFTRLAGARLVAGGLYAFSPYVLRNTVIGHFGLTMTAYLPLVLLLGLRLLDRDARPVRIGLWLALLTVVQFFTGLEVEALAAVTCVLCLLGALVLRPETVRRARAQLLTAGAVAASISAAVLGYFVWYFVAGPRHVVGPFWPVRSAQASGILLPGPDVFSTHTGLALVGYLGRQGPDTDYLGIGLLLAVALSVPLWRRRASCRVLLAVGVLSWVLEFVPTALWSKLPFLSSIEPVRFALPASLCVALLLAASVDAWWSAVSRWFGEPSRSALRHAGRGAVVVLTGASFLPLVHTYTLPLRVTRSTVPAWFEHEGAHLPAGTAVLTVPLAWDITSQSMAWQAETGDHFVLVGGWAFVPGGNGVDDQTISPLGGAIGALRVLSSHPFHLTVAQAQAIRAALVRWQPLDVVVVPGLAPLRAVEALRDILGIAPVRSDGAWVWSLRRTTRLGPMVPLLPRTLPR